MINNILSIRFTASAGVHTLPGYAWCVQDREQSMRLYDQQKNNIQRPDYLRTQV